jgi:hypothetical protein
MIIWSYFYLTYIQCSDFSQTCEKVTLSSRSAMLLIYYHNYVMVKELRPTF